MQLSESPQNTQIRYFLTDGYTDFHPGSSLVRAAYHLTRDQLKDPSKPDKDFRNSEGEKRRKDKKNENLLEICHLVMCNDILAAAENSDYRERLYPDYIKAAAIMHDLIEDIPLLVEISKGDGKIDAAGKHLKETFVDYIVKEREAEKRQKWKLANDAADPEQKAILEKEAKSIDVTKTTAKHDAQQVIEICKELTNPTDMPGGKRFTQVAKSRNLSRDAALVKIVDQMASIIDHILEEEVLETKGTEKKKGKSPERMKAGRIAWRNKAYDVCKNIAERHPDLEMWKNLFQAVYKYDMEIIENGENSEKAAELREKFSFAKMLEKAAGEKRVVAAPGTVVQGCTYIGLSHHGNVVSFGLRVRNETKKKSPENDEAIKPIPENDAAIELINALEADNDNPNGNHVETGRIYQDNDSLLSQMNTLYEEVFSRLETEAHKGEAIATINNVLKKQLEADITFEQIDTREKFISRLSIAIEEKYHDKADKFEVFLKDMQNPGAELSDDNPLKTCKAKKIVPNKTDTYSCQFKVQEGIPLKTFFLKAEAANALSNELKLALEKLEKGEEAAVSAR